MDSLLECINSTFLKIHPIKEILVILGASVTVPKDCYQINFPDELYDGPVLTQKTCVSSLFKTLITSDLLQNQKPLNASSALSVFFLAPRNCDYGYSKLVPRLSFRTPVTGKHYSINCKSTGKNVKVCNADLSVEADSFNLSGFEPLENSFSNEQFDSSSTTESNSSCVGLNSVQKQ